MEFIQNLFSPEIIEAIGWTLLHSLWQGTIVAVLLGIIMLCIKNHSAQIKYVVAFFSLIILTSWSAVTFNNSYKYAKEKARIRSGILYEPNYINNYLTEKKQDSEIQNALTSPQKNKTLQTVQIRSFFQRNFNYIIAAWLLGIFILGTNMIAGSVYTYRLKHYRVVHPDQKLLDLIVKFANKLNIKRKISGYLSPLAKVPVTFGAVKPIILFPITVFTGLSSKDIEAIIAHEIAHIARHDYLLNILQAVIETVYFFHPAVWIISGKIKTERENSCDNIAVSLTGDKVAYIKALAKVQINQIENNTLAMAFIASKGGVLQRIKRLQTQTVLKSSIAEKLIAFSIVALSLTLVSFVINTNRFVPENEQGHDKIIEIKGTNTVQESNTNGISIDSLKKQIEDDVIKTDQPDDVKQEIDKLLEVALSEPNDSLSAQMITEIGKAVSTLGKVLNTVIIETANAFTQNGFNATKANTSQNSKPNEPKDSSTSVLQSITANTTNIINTGLNIASPAMQNTPMKKMINTSLSVMDTMLKTIIEINSAAGQETEEMTTKDMESIKAKLKEKDEQLEKEKMYLRELQAKTKNK